MIPVKTPNPLYAALILFVIFVSVNAVSWQAWTNPIVDGGREMNTPLRILRGERLYSQVYYQYGPITPYFNALLYRCFGVRLNTLYAAGLVGSFLLVLMIFHLGLRIMPVYAATLAAVASILFSIYKLSGNLVFPYTYAVLYGTLLGTLALIAQVHFARSRRTSWLVAAGLLSGLALCCKIEFGLAAIASLFALVISAPRRQRARIACFSLGTCVIFPVLIYGLVLTRISAESLLKGTLLIPKHTPGELMQFSMMILGLNTPGKTIREMINALAVLLGASGVISLASIRMTGESIAWTEANHRIRRIWWWTIACLGVVLIHLLIFGTAWTLNPFRALPLLFIGMIYYCIKRRSDVNEMDASTRSILLVAVYSLFVLTRVILRVPASSVYSVGLLPVPLLLFVYMAVVHLPASAVSVEAAKNMRRTVVLLLSISLFGAIGVFSYRQSQFSNFPLDTPRGSLRLPPSIHSAMKQALDFITQNSSSGEYILALPEGSSLNFLADRPTPLRYEIVTPGYLTEAAEHQAIRRIREKNVRFIFILNRPTREFGPVVFGRDYYHILMGWIESNYSLTAVFGDQVSSDARIGDAQFFIKCYRRNPQEPARGK